MNFTLTDTIMNLRDCNSPYYKNLLPIDRFTKTELPTQQILPKTCDLPDSTVAAAAIHLARILCGEPASQVFNSNLNNAATACFLRFEEKIDPVRNSTALNPASPIHAPIILRDDPNADADFDTVRALVDSIQGRDWNSVHSICKLTDYDNLSHTSSRSLHNEETISPETVHTIQIMAKRYVAFLQQYDSTVRTDYTFDTENYPLPPYRDRPIFPSADTLWLFLSTRSRPSGQHALYLLLYYLMGTRSDPEIFGSINKLGIYNPRHNTVYTLALDRIDPDLIEIATHKFLKL